MRCSAEHLRAVPALFAIGVPLLLAVQPPAWGGHDTFPSVTVAQQADRDATRLAILRAELAAEEQGLARSKDRLAERTAAGDAEGIEEARRSEDTHRRNIEALRAEIDQMQHSESSPAVPTPSGGRKKARRVVPARRAAGPAADTRTHPWWDAYGNRPRTNFEPSAPREPQPGAMPGASRPGWSAYPGGSEQ